MERQGAKLIQTLEVVVEQLDQWGLLQTAVEDLGIRHAAYGVRDFAPPLPPPRDVAGGFREIAAAAANCRFRDCLHRSEPGCAVATAGGISPRRLESYRRLLALAEEMAARAASRVRR